VFKGINILVTGRCQIHELRRITLGLEEKSCAPCHRGLIAMSGPQVPLLRPGIGGLPRSQRPKNNTEGAPGRFWGPGRVAAAYAQNGNILAHADSVMGTWNFTYDGVDRLMTAQQTAYTATSQKYAGNYGCWNWTYDSFGNITNFTGTLRNPFQYTGREYDSETNLYFYRARYYDPVAGRFVNEDPIRFKGGNNFYTYVLNDPVILRDPTGLCGCPERDSCYAEARQNLSLELMACGLVCLVQPELCPECIAGAGAVYSLELLICRFNRPC